MNLLPRIVVPTVAAVGVLYPASFLVGLWQSAEQGELNSPGAHVAGGALETGWRYDVYERAFPKTWRMDLTDADQGLARLCMLEVRGGPAPVSAVSGPGTLVYVTLAGEVDRAGPRLSINLAGALENRCAAVIADGKVVYGDVPLADPPAEEEPSLIASTAPPAG